GLAVALNWKSRWSSATGGALVGGGVAGMHYLGMWAMQLPGQITWAADLVIASILLGAALAALAFMVARRHRGATGDLAATLLLT
uniref:MHYT domain-containing protein n=1 Tax=Stenotrophomonas maltophilia TaxID=40324 RepID=UPI0023B7AAC2